MRNLTFYLIILYICFVNYGLVAISKKHHMNKLYLIILFIFYTISVNCQEIKLVNFIFSDCDKSVDVYRIKTRIINQNFSGDTLQINVGLVALCCVDFLPSIKFENDTLDLLYTETGVPCDCVCCYQFSYYITGITSKTFKVKLQSKFIELSDEKFKTYPIKYFIFNNDTTGYRDKYGLRQGIQVIESGEYVLETHFKDDIPIKYVRTDKHKNIVKEGFDMFDVFYNDK